MNCLIAILAVLSVWDYPARYPQHERLRDQFIVAMRTGDTATMEETCRKGVQLLPDDPTWHYNLACSLAWFPNRKVEAFDELEKAIDLGFRDPEAIRKDTDLRRISNESRFGELVEYAKTMQTRPILTGPLAVVDATGVFGSPIALGEQNLSWDFDVGCFTAQLKLAEGQRLPWTGDLYMNRDGGHSPNGLEAKKTFLDMFPGITDVRFDAQGRRLGLDLNAPNVLFPYPVFGNSSMAFQHPVYWRSIPRSLMTSEARRMKAMERLYLSNQVWVFPSNRDTAPVGTNGDVFASIAPYWLTTAGRSWSDIPYLRAALLASGHLPRKVKAEIVNRRLLAPTVMTLVRKGLLTVRNEDDYTSLLGHPTALPPNGVDTNRVMALARAMTVAAIPPIVPISVRAVPTRDEPVWPELTYGSNFAWAYVLRSEDDFRTFEITAAGAQEYRFVQTHGMDVKVEIDRIKPNRAKITIDRVGMSPTKRVDLAVFGRNPGTGWGAPSYVSFARMDPSTPYSDPMLTPLKDPPPAERPEADKPAPKAPPKK